MEGWRLGHDPTGGASSHECGGTGVRCGSVPRARRRWPTRSGHWRTSGICARCGISRGPGEGWRGPVAGERRVRLRVGARERPALWPAGKFQTGASQAARVFRTARSELRIPSGAFRAARSERRVPSGAFRVARSERRVPSCASLAAHALRAARYELRVPSGARVPNGAFRTARVPISAFRSAHSERRVTSRASQAARVPNCAFRTACSKRRVTSCARFELRAPSGAFRAARL